MAQEGVEKDDTALLTALAVIALGLVCFIAFVVYRIVQSVRGVRRDPLRRESGKGESGEDDRTASSFWRLFRRYLWSSGDSSPGESGGGDWGATGDSGGGDSGD